MCYRNQSHAHRILKVNPEVCCYYLAGLMDVIHVMLHNNYTKHYYIAMQVYYIITSSGMKCTIGISPIQVLV